MLGYRCVVIAAIVIIAVACRNEDRRVIPESEQFGRADVVVALVAGSPLSADVLRRHLAHAGADLGPERIAEKKQAVLDELIRTKALAVAGRRAGYADDPEIVEVVDRMVADRYLRDLMEQEPAALPEISDQAVAAYYADHLADFSQPGRARAALVLLVYPADADETARGALHGRAESLRQQALTSDDSGFAELAREHSQHPSSRERGGDLGWLLEGGRDYRVPDPVATAIFQLERPGDVTPVVDVDRGVAFARLVAREAASPKSLEAVDAEIREILRAEQLRVAREARIDRLVEELGVEIHHDVLDRLVSPGQTPAASVMPPSFPLGEAVDGGGR